MLLFLVDTCKVARMLAQATYIPANKSRWPNVGLLLAHRLRRWPDGKPTLAQGPIFSS